MPSEDITENIVPIVFSRPSLHNDGRVRRQIQFLSKKYLSQVVFIGKLESIDDFNSYLFDYGKGYPYAKPLLLSKRKRYKVLLSHYSRYIFVPFLILYKAFRLFCYRLRVAFSNTNFSPKIRHKLYTLYRLAVKLFSRLVPQSLTPVAVYYTSTSTILGDLLLSRKFSCKSFHIYFNDIESICILSSLENYLALSSHSSSKLLEKIKFIHLDLHEYFLDQTAVKRISSQIDEYIDLIRSTHQTYPFSISTVSSSLASLYQKHFNIDGLDVHAIYNAPLYSSPQYPSINVDPITLIASNRTEKIKIIHHGIASSFRQLDTLLHSLNNSEKLAKTFELNLMLVANSPLQKDYLSYLKDLAACSSVLINFLDPVPTDNIVNTISQFDIAFVGIPPISTSYANCLPNKFFESIHAGLALIAGPSLDMVSLIDKFNLGIGLNDYTEYEITQALLIMSDCNFHSYKKNSCDAAIHLSFESVADLYLPTYLR